MKHTGYISDDVDLFGSNLFRYLQLVDPDNVAYSFVARGLRFAPFPYPLFSLFASQDNPDMRSCAASGLKCPEEILCQCARDEDDYVRAAVAGNPSCPDYLFPELALDQSAKVLSAVARNPSCPESIQVKLWEERDCRPSIISNPNCAPEIWQHVLKTRHFWTLVIDNPRCPSYILEEVSLLDNYYKRILCRKRYLPKSILSKLAKDPMVFDDGLLIHNPSCPEEILLEFSNHPNPSIRTAVAEHPNCPAGILEKLSRDPERSVRMAVAENLNCSCQTLDALEHSADRLLQIVVANTRRIRGILDTLAGIQSASAKLFHAILTEWRYKRHAHAFDPLLLLLPHIASHAPDLVKFDDSVQSSRLYAALVANTTTPEFWLRKHFSHYAQWRVLQMLAEHPNTHDAVRTLLTEQMLQRIA